MAYLNELITEMAQCESRYRAGEVTELYYIATCLRSLTLVAVDMERTLNNMEESLLIIRRGIHDAGE